MQLESQGTYELDQIIQLPLGEAVDIAHRRAVPPVTDQLFDGGVSTFTPVAAVAGHRFISMEALDNVVGDAHEWLG